MWWRSRLPDAACAKVSWHFPPRRWPPASQRFICSRLSRTNPYVAVSGFLTGHFNYATSFLDIHALLAMGIFLLPLLGFYFELPKAARRLTPPLRFWLAVIAALLFITLPIAKPIWDHVTATCNSCRGTFRFFIAMLPGVIFIVITWLPEQRKAACSTRRLSSRHMDARRWPAPICIFSSRARRPPTFWTIILSMCRNTRRAGWKSRAWDIHCKRGSNLPPKYGKDIKPAFVVAGKGAAYLSLPINPGAITPAC